MKKFLLSLSALAALFSMGEVSALIVENVAAPNSVCDGGTFNTTFYGNFRGNLWDRFDAINETYIGANSRVQIYVRANKVNIPDGWVQTTSHAPSAGGYFVFWNNQLSSLNLANLVPADRGTPVAQVSYVTRRVLRSNAGAVVNGQYYTAPYVAGAIPVPADSGNLARRFDLTNVGQDRECYNIYPRWCGDGVRDAEELCDPLDATRSGLLPGESCTPACTVVSLVSSTSCASASVSAPSVTIGGSNTFTCNALAPNAATIYEIECGNGQSARTTSNTLTCNYLSVGSFAPRCRVDAEPTFSNTCTASVTVTSGGGGSSASCQSISLSATGSNVGTLSSTITCNSNLPAAANLYTFECGNGTVFSGSLNTATCNYTTAGTFAPRCRVNNESTPVAACSATVTVTGIPGGGSSGGGGTPGGGGWSPQGVCGDGIIQRPNSAGQNEDCDAGANNGRPGYACSATCNIGSTNPGGTANQIRMTTTNPGSMGSMAISEYRAIVGDSVRIFSNSDALSFSATYPILITGKDTYVTNTSNVVSGGDLSRVISESDLCVGPSGSAMRIGTPRTESVCTGSAPSVSCHDEIFWSFRSIDCRPSYVLWSGSELRNFKGKTSPLTATEAYRDTASDEFLVGIRFLQEGLKVRVSKPAISNTAGGNAYLGRATGYDVNTIAGIFLENLRKGNFTTASTVSWDLGYGRNLSSATASSTRTITSNDTQIGTLASTSAGDFIGNVRVSSEADFLQLPKLGDSEGVRVLATGTLEVGTLSGDLPLMGVRTIVIENGTLHITGNLTYSNKDASYAFVVKNGKITIDPGVTAIAGVFLVMNGKIEGTGAKTPNRLSVDGNLYGNAASLVEDRTYVRATNFSSALTTGVTINYSSRAIRNPPPLLTQFVEQYSIGKVAK